MLLQLSLQLTEYARQNALSAMDIARDYRGCGRSFLDIYRWLQALYREPACSVPPVHHSSPVGGAVAAPLEKKRKAVPVSSARREGFLETHHDVAGRDDVLQTLCEDCGKSAPCSQHSVIHTQSSCCYIVASSVAIGCLGRCASAASFAVLMNHIRTKLDRCVSVGSDSCCS